MNVSEKTNEELAKNIDQFAAIKGSNCDVCLMFREAAARLRNADKQKSINKELVDEMDALRAKLKVAEDALELCISGMCGECSRQHPDGTCVEGCYEMLTAKNALAAIRAEEGSAK